MSGEVPSCWQIGVGTYLIFTCPEVVLWLTNIAVRSGEYTQQSVSWATSWNTLCQFLQLVCISVVPLKRFLDFFFIWHDSPQWDMASSFTRFLDHTHRHTIVGRTPLDGWSARRRDLYLTTHNIHNRQTSMAPVGFEPTISAGERPQTYDLNRADTGTGLS